LVRTECTVESNGVICSLITAPGTLSHLVAGNAGCTQSCHTVALWYEVRQVKKNVVAWL
jgi:hypothetical protein